MAKTKVLTITIQHQPAVAAIAKVNILALLGTAQGATGTVHLVVEDAKRAKKALDEAKLVYQETGAEQHELANKPGALAQQRGRFQPCDAPPRKSAVWLRSES